MASSSQIDVSKSNILPFSSSSSVTDADASQDLPSTPPSSMSIKEIKDELKGMGISFADCFDKDSLCERLEDARNGKFASVSSTSRVEGTTSSGSGSGSGDGGASTTSSGLDREAIAADLRTKTVRQLRTLCAQSNIRWANLIEKEELVQALVKYQEECLKFSVSGKIMPGKVALIDDDTLSKELTSSSISGSRSSNNIPPLLLDVFATWCGPCKMMSPFLEDAAAELGDKVRVAKIDSDQYPEWASKLNVRSLPTIVVFDGKTGKELERVEGAMRTDQLVKLAMKHV
eukprot:CAMPEP_0176499920 /NCGR_PEP_ID=MMETSP0200_2-20121128/13218_1 /TAXON_ID=947934 /ORGANISM="Chaetoceros sp., Strain GSL56" /LENGTH=287 /DNA_ID=CAMNT_0017898439 /DNA_START=181 /DNA_END=1044 /DNA_ORIENTATION=-